MTMCNMTNCGGDYSVIDKQTKTFSVETIERCNRCSHERHVSTPVEIVDMSRFMTGPTLLEAAQATLMFLSVAVDDHRAAYEWRKLTNTINITPANLKKFVESAMSRHRTSL